MLRERGAYVDLSGGAHTPGAKTLLVNAAIMTVDGQPLHAPWVVDLDVGAKTASKDSKQ